MEHLLFMECDAGAVRNVPRQSNLHELKKMKSVALSSLCRMMMLQKSGLKVAEERSKEEAISLRPVQKELGLDLGLQGE